MKQIKEVLLDSSEKLQGHINYEQYQNHIITAIFYKYLSHRIEKENNKRLFKYNINFKEAFYNENIEYYGNNIKDESLKELGYFIHPNNLYSQVISDDNLLERLDSAINDLIFKDNSFNDVFDEVDFKNINLTQEFVGVFEEVLKDIDQLSFNNKCYDEYNYLMKYFFKKSYTPTEVSTLLANLTANNDKGNVNVYDAACGSASTLLEFNDKYSNICYYGQEINKTRYNLARINMFMHSVSLDNFRIYNDDSTTTNRKLPLMDMIVSHPPFLKKWEANDELITDERFCSFKKLPPKSRADYAFIESMIYYLKQDGLMAVVLPQGILFRSNAEKEIRKTFLEEKNYIDAVIGLPDKIFHKNIPTCILLLRKNRKKEDKVLFIDASQDYIKDTKLNVIKHDAISKIVDTYKNKKIIDKYSYAASIGEIKQNEYNLNIKRYINNYVEREKIDLKVAITHLKELDLNIEDLNKKQDELIDVISKK
ncbi:MAG: type I restriction-modification system subunit M [Methanosphaera stadtmanae]|nr:type I restriction-modification system subunit M [Methanosphaera stadtmanae]